ncbi:MAG: DUF4292 domain-containing protein [Terracidiphilus sp.]
MKHSISAGILFLALAGTFTLNAQTAQQPAAATPPVAQTAPSADDIVARHLDAVGGKAAISQVKSITMETTVMVMGNEAPGTTTILEGVGYKSETDFNSATIVQCFNDKGGWQQNPMAGAADPTPMPDDQYKNGRDGMYIGAGLYDYAAMGSKLELVPGSDDAYKLKLTNKDGVESTFTIDPKTYLIKSLARKAQLQGQDVTMTVNYSDYRKTETGYLMPYHLDLDFGGQFQMSIVVKNIELNKTIDPAIFLMPKPAAQPAAQ